MAKIKDYGYKTPVRRNTNNITGHKVIGDHTGGECKIVDFNFFKLNNNSNSFSYYVKTINSQLIFNRELIVFAIGGYFYCENKVKIILKIKSDIELKSEHIIESGDFEKIGLSIEVDQKQISSIENIEFTISFETFDNEEITIYYNNFSFGNINKDYFLSNDVYDTFFNSKKTICYPEQFYFEDQFILNENENVNTKNLILKSCNRCQRFLPINHLNERKQLAFSNHCSTKAPCKHSNFSNYKILSSTLSDNDLNDFISSTPYNLKDGNIISFFGHQLECKSCKKFFVNASLNHLRTSTQHREDGLRRRAFELLTRDLLDLKWIYHSFRKETGLEFDKYIWERFDKKCFNCSIQIDTPNDMDLDHTMPLVGLYPLDESATCLCPSCNGKKSDLYPSEFYTIDKIQQLSEITGIDISIMKDTKPNQKVIDLLKDNVVWFFEEFLTFEEYTKERDGKRACDSILHSLQKTINKSSNPYNLIDLYSEKKINS